MECHCIPYTQIPQASRLLTDYLYNFSRVSEFYLLNPFEEASFSKAAGALRYSEELRRTVVAVLQEQNQYLAVGEKTSDNLKKLEKAGCFAVVTGQQVGLFTGPAFAIYKALTAIKLSQSLNQKGLPSVPVFWLATEDHDLAEVNHCFIQDREGNSQRLEYSGASPIPDAPVGAVQFTGEIQTLLGKLEELLSDSPVRDELVRMIAECYRPGESFGVAFGRLMARLFTEFGVILVDPMDARLHRLSSRVFRVAIESAPVVLEELLERNRSLTEKGYHIQVRINPNSTLLFYLADGRRSALRLSEEGRFALPHGQTYTQEELLQHLEQHPEVFSPNVLLRPLMQDALLPTIAYVGGPSELAYLAQAGPIYNRVLGRMPVVFPRASFTILDRPTNRLLEKYALTLPDIYAGKQALRERMAARFFPADLIEIFQRTKEGLGNNLQALQKALAQLDPTLVEAAANSGQKMRYQISNLERKAALAVQHRTEHIERDAERLENSLYPHKTSQERVYSGIGYLARYGPQFLHQIFEQIPLHSGHHQPFVL